ncbi:MAG: hypothetical protein JNM18_26290 [Planctomycetaceae bacterium]|nr:hypothetical protein [Planctomycetaceae bacterium]
MNRKPISLLGNTQILLDFFTHSNGLHTIHNSIYSNRIFHMAPDGVGRWTSASDAGPTTSNALLFNILSFFGLQLFRDLREYAVPFTAQWTLAIPRGCESSSRELQVSGTSDSTNSHHICRFQTAQADVAAEGA